VAITLVAINVVEQLGLHFLQCLNVVDLPEGVLDTLQSLAVFAIFEVARNAYTRPGLSLSLLDALNG